MEVWKYESVEVESVLFGQSFLAATDFNGRLLPSDLSQVSDCFVPEVVRNLYRKSDEHETTIYIKNHGFACWQDDTNGEPKGTGRHYLGKR
jgi:hypothetical protein